ncbi:endonuclease III [Enterococcus timonensis]|uniref:endonuclease III n=1 Tax=Enterococcus timonensis TaxID=1852364 RepID=UPI000A7A18A5|nr:endonuclease III [Enterococcus timonensis]
MSQLLSQKKIRECLLVMQEMFPNAHGELVWDTPFHLLVAVILSAQATDISVNKATPALFSAYPNPADLAQADLFEIEGKIKTIGLYKSKARHLKAMAQMLHETFHDQVPNEKQMLLTMPGVGPKTANVLLGEAYKIPGIAVDTHVERVSKRLRFVKQSATVSEVEEKLMAALPKEQWVKDHHTLIFFGRYHCTARNPKCEVCPLLASCAFGQKYVGQ